MALIDISILILTLFVVFAIRVAVIHASAKWLLPPSRDVRLTQALKLAGIGILLGLIPFPIIGAILFIGYAARIYNDDRLFGLAIALIAWLAGAIMRYGIEYIGGMLG